MTVVGLAALLYGEWSGREIFRRVGKPFASLGFIVAGIGLGALESWYGQVVLVGLVLGAIGDVCLLSRQKSFFLAGLVSFLLGHVAYVFAFGALPHDRTAGIIAAAITGASLAVIARWVWPHVAELRVPVAVYMAVIGAMCVVAVAAGGAGASWTIPIGAIMFTVSDVSVVRDRFIIPGFDNKAWGLPLYYFGQLVIAQSIAVTTVP